MTVGLGKYELVATGPGEAPCLAGRALPGTRGAGSPPRPRSAPGCCSRHPVPPPRRPVPSTLGPHGHRHRRRATPPARHRACPPRPVPPHRRAGRPPPAPHPPPPPPPPPPRPPPP